MPDARYAAAAIRLTVRLVMRLLVSTSLHHPDDVPRGSVTDRPDSGATWYRRASRLLKIAAGKPARRTWRREMRYSRLAALWGLTAALLHTPPVAAATCESLASISLPSTTITAAQTVAAGAYVPPAPARRGGGNAAPQGRGNAFADLPEFCRVAATLRPSSDSDIKMEIWMPAPSAWNGKFVVPGNGGFAGAIAPAGLATNIRNGYAAATTEPGHDGG